MVALFLCSIALFSACGQADSLSQASSTETPAPVSQVDPGNVSTEGSDLTMVTNLYGAFDEAGGKDGFYKLYPNPEGGSNLIYADYGTGAVIFLCNRPECLHKDDSCPAWFPFGIGSIFMNAAQDTLFCVGSTESGAETIWAMEPNGANRRLFYQCAPRERMIDAIASDSTALYFALSTVDASTGAAEKKLLRIDLQSGQSEEICAYGSSDWLFGVCGDQLLLLYSEDNFYQYNLLSPADGTQTECYRFESDPDQPESGKKVYPDGGFLYIFSPNGDDTAQLMKLDIRSGASTLICDGFPWYGAGTAFVQGVYDDRLIVDLSDTRGNDPTKVRHYRYFIDCETGAYTESSLTYSQGALTSFVTIAAQTQDYFVVSKGVHSTPVLLTGNDGTMYESTLEVPEYALISKADYWASNPDYQELAMETLFS